jgi:hypothetical protein
MERRRALTRKALRPKKFKDKPFGNRHIGDMGYKIGQAFRRHK